MSIPKPSDEAASTPPAPSSNAQGAPPALPPRPPSLLPLMSPRPRPVPPPHAPAYQSPTSPQTLQQFQGSAVGAGTINHTCGHDAPWYSVLFQKYVLLTVISGALSVILGSLFIAIYFIVRNTTTSLHYFETLPTYIPGVTMTLTGLMVMMFSKTSNRKSVLVKVCGCFCLLSALLCVVVTVTTTVVHMNRLQTLRECVYQASTKTCTCFAGIMDHRTLDHDAALRYVFAAAPSCEVIHGTIYTCLRAMFGLSVIGILVSIFSCMLVYQILSHEKKKKYLAELNSRCRSLYQRPGFGHSNLSQCSAGGYPWLLNNRLCSGNLYTPTPELSISTISTTLGGVTTPHGTGTGNRITEAGTGSQSSSSAASGAWSWLPWSRKHSTSRQVTPGAPGIVHSASEVMVRSRGHQQVPGRSAAPHWRYSHSDAIYGFRPPGTETLASTMSSYNMAPPGVTGLGQYNGRLDLTNIDSLSNLLWGPPPPYSQPEPASRPGSSGGGDRGTQSPEESPARSQSRISRTTKSGILIENGSDGGAGSESGGASSHYDDTVDSAMHIYEKLRRSRSGSLPSRKVKKNRKIASTTSSNNLISGSDLTPPVPLTQNLSALNLSRSEELRTAKDLEEIKRALIALQHNSLGLLNNIQFDNNNQISSPGEFQQKIEFSSPSRQDSGVPSISQAKPVTHNPGHKHKKSRGPGVYSLSPEHQRPSEANRGHQRSPVKSSGPTAFLRSPKKTISTSNLISSGTESDNSYGVASSVSGSGGSRTSSSLSSPTPTSLGPYFTNQMQKNKSGSPLGPSSLNSFPDSLIRTGALPHINSSIIQTANSQLLANSQLANSQLLANSQQLANSKLLANSQLANSQQLSNSQLLANSQQLAQSQQLANFQMLANSQANSHLLANSQVLASSQANSQMLASSQAKSQMLATAQANSQLLANYSQPLPGKLPLSLSGLLSPRHTQAPHNTRGSGNRSEPRALPLPPARQASSQPSLVSPARMMPPTFTPSGTTGNRTPTSPGSGLVYLRQDQNIPENFCDKFRPIEPASDKAPSVDIKNISSDDIVVTLHSVNV